jgi:hypothetical protein
MASTPAQIPYFGRAWQIKLEIQGGPTVVLSSSNTDNPLRTLIKVETAVLNSRYWIADITIFNLNPQLLSAQSGNVPVNEQWQFNQQTKLGDIISVSAGFTYSASGAFDPANNLIFKGVVFQPIWTRESVVNWKLDLRCILGLMEDTYNVVNFTLGAGATPYDVLSHISRTSGVAIDQVDQDRLTQQKAPRAQTIMGRPGEALRQLSKDYGLQYWISPNGINMRKMSVDANTVPRYTYGPPNLANYNTGSGKAPSAAIKRTLLGTPAQTQQGVIFRVLMDAQPKLGEIVGLAPGTIISKLPYTPGQLPSILDQNGVYIISGINHVGDSRGTGDDWYTEITAMTSAFFPSMFLPTTPNVT